MREKGMVKWKLDEIRLRFGPSCSNLHWWEIRRVDGQRRSRDVRNWALGGALRICGANIYAWRRSQLRLAVLNAL